MIRAATPADAAALAAIERRAWLGACSDELDPERMAHLEERRERRADGRNGAERTLVFDQDGLLAGFAAVAPARDADLGPGVGELLALSVDPPAQGAGVGGSLLDAAAARLRTQELAAAVVWVLAADGHARHVYERRGWALEPERTRLELWAPEVRYRLAL